MVPIRLLSTERIGWVRSTSLICLMMYAGTPIARIHMQKQRNEVAGAVTTDQQLDRHEGGSRHDGEHRLARRAARGLIRGLRWDLRGGP